VSILHITAKEIHDCTYYTQKPFTAIPTICFLILNYRVGHIYFIYVLQARNDNYNEEIFTGTEFCII